MIVREEVLARAALVERLRAEVHRLWTGPTPPSKRRTARDAAALEAQQQAHHNAARDFHAACQEFEGPLRAILAGVREGHSDAVAEAVIVLEADPTCYRSGYIKADLMHAVANAPSLDGPTLLRLQDVVVQRLARPQGRLLRHAIRLATAVWDEEFDARLRALAAAGHEPAAEQARRLLHAVHHHGRLPDHTQDSDALESAALIRRPRHHPRPAPRP